MKNEIKKCTADQIRDYSIQVYDHVTKPYQ